jgi:hypothetical protein
MAPQRTVVITGSAPQPIGLKPHSPGAEKFLACNKLRFFSNDSAEARVLFTESARSATINHNDLDTCKMPPLLLGTERGGLRSGILLRASEAMTQIADAVGTIRAALLQSPQSIHHVAHALSCAAQSHRRPRSRLHRSRLAPLIQGRKT